MDRTSRYARCGEADTFLNIIEDHGKRYEAKVKETRKLESRMMRQVSSPVRRRAGRKGHTDLARSLSYFNILEVLFLERVSSAFLPSKNACWAHKFRHVGVRQRYPGICVHVRLTAPTLQIARFIRMAQVHGPLSQRTGAFPFFRLGCQQSTV